MAVRAERCPSCRALLGPRVEGALAPDLSAVTPPRQEGPLVPAVKRKDKDRAQNKTWQEEVRDRVKHRRQKRRLPQEEAGDNLPLFREAKAVPERAGGERPAAPSDKSGVPRQSEASAGARASADRSTPERAASRLERPLQDWSARSQRREAVPATSVSEVVPSISLAPASEVEAVQGP